MLLLLIVSTYTGTAPAYAGNTIQWGNTKDPVSSIQLVETPSDPEGCHAKVFFKNYHVHVIEDNNSWELSVNDLFVGVSLSVDVYGPDTIYVDTPDGYFAWPDSITVPEEETGEVCIYKEGVYG